MELDVILTFKAIMVDSLLIILLRSRSTQESYSKTISALTSQMIPTLNDDNLDNPQ